MRAGWSSRRTRDNNKANIALIRISVVALDL